MRYLTMAGMTLALAACASVPPSSDETYFVREGMVHGINPAITAIWDMQVEVMDDYGNFDPALMDEGKWGALLGHSREMAREAQRMAAATRFVVADPAGELTQAPEGTDLAAIQARLDTQTDSYRAMSGAYADHVAQLVGAVEARDAAEVTRLVNDTQPVCKACHDAFWYPEEQ